MNADCVLQAIVKSDEEEETVLFVAASMTCLSNFDRATIFASSTPIQKARVILWFPSD